MSQWPVLTETRPSFFVHELDVRSQWTSKVYRLDTKFTEENTEKGLISGGDGFAVLALGVAVVSGENWTVSRRETRNRGSHTFDYSQRRGNCLHCRHRCTGPFRYVVR